MLREYVFGEAMHALGIPTTRALAVVSTALVALMICVCMTGMSSPSLVALVAGRAVGAAQSRHP